MRAKQADKYQTEEFRELVYMYAGKQGWLGECNVSITACRIVYWSENIKINLELTLNKVLIKNIIRQYLENENYSQTSASQYSLQQS